MRIEEIQFPTPGLMKAISPGEYKAGKSSTCRYCSFVSPKYKGRYADKCPGCGKPRKVEEESMTLANEVLKLCESLKIGDLVKIDMVLVKKRDSSPAYLKLINKTIKDAKGAPEIIEIKNKMIGLASDRYSALLGLVWVAAEAVKRR